MILRRSKRHDLARLMLVANSVIGILALPYILIGVSLFLFPIFGYILLFFYWLESKPTSHHSLPIWIASFAYNFGVSLFYAARLEEIYWTQRINS
jgi:hypothetical protein